MKHTRGKRRRKCGKLKKCAAEIEKKRRKKKNEEEVDEEEEEEHCGSRISENNLRI